MTLHFLVVALLYFRYCISCPTGYTYCSSENQPCSATGVIAYGAGTSYTYQTPFTPFTCNNTEFGNPIDGTTKECCSQSPTITGTVSPIVATISCGETKNLNWRADTSHFYKLTTTRFLNIQFSTCQSGMDTILHVSNAAGNYFSEDFCGNSGDDCYKDSCTTPSNNEIFTIPSLLPDSYYIEVRAYNSSTSGSYQLSVTCVELDFGFQHLGCYADVSSSTRAMSEGPYNTHNIQSCYELCKLLNYAYFGVQYGYECFCSNSYNESIQYGTSTACSAPCGNAALINFCEFPGTGGNNAFDLYKINTLSPTEIPSKTPTNNPSKSPSKSTSKYPTLNPSKTPTKTPSTDPPQLPATFYPTDTIPSPTRSPLKFCGDDGYNNKKRFKNKNDDKSNDIFPTENCEFCMCTDIGNEQCATIASVSEYFQNSFMETCGFVDQCSFDQIGLKHSDSIKECACEIFECKPITNDGNTYIFGCTIGVGILSISQLLSM